MTAWGELLDRQPLTDEHRRQRYARHDLIGWRVFAGLCIVMLIGDLVIALLLA